MKGFEKNRKHAVLYPASPSREQQADTSKYTVDNLQAEVELQPVEHIHTLQAWVVSGMHISAAHSFQYTLIYPPKTGGNCISSLQLLYTPPPEILNFGLCECSTMPDGGTGTMRIEAYGKRGMGHHCKNSFFKRSVTDRGHFVVCTRNHLVV
jgi:hypothetical protein